MKRLLLLIFILIQSLLVNGQIQQSEPIPSIIYDVNNKDNLPTIKLRDLDLVKLNKEDEIDNENGIPPRFGFRHEVNLNMKNSGKWIDLSENGKIWTLKITSDKALSLSLLFDEFWMPDNGKLFVYNENKSKIIGAITSANNKDKKGSKRGFATDLIYGNTIIIEYYQPINEKQEPDFSIKYIVEGYKYIEKIVPEYFGSSGACQVDINCEEGNNWQMEKNAVAMIIVNGNRYCTGALLRNTADDNKSLFLTADHCLGGWGNSNIKYDAVTNPNLDHWTFWWKYESPTCNDTGAEPSHISTSGAVILANNSTTDFALLELTENPTSNVCPLYFLGWDRGTPQAGGVGIHHPAGDTKKIATHNITPTTYNTNYHHILWQQTTNGFSVTEGGSSGSPLLNSNHRVIGQLYGGSSVNCSNPASDFAIYGKLHLSWNNSAGPQRRLKDWLDPINSDVQYLDGNPYSDPTSILDLYIKDCETDFGQEPSGCVEFWDSPDIWVRNNQDGQLQNQNPIYRPNGVPNYIYVKVRNRNCVASSGNEQLKIYWAKANTSYAWPDYWDGSILNNGYPLSGGLNPVNIPIIQPGEEAIVAIPWIVPNPANYSNMEEPWHYCLMARIESSNDPMTFPETEDSGANIRNNNNIAQKNVSVVNPSPGNPIGAIVGVGNAFPVHRDFIFEFKVKPSELDKLIYEEAEVTIELDNRLLQTWVDAGRSLINMKQISENTFLITADNASFGGLHFEPNQIDLLSLRFNFLTAEITDKEQYTYYVIQKDLDGTVIGGETYEIRKEINRDLFYAEIDGDTEVNKNEPVLLSAESINEPALYNWYDVEGNLLHEGIDFATSVAAGKSYKLEVIALADGYKDYSEVELKLKPNAIEIIYPNPASDVLTVDYKINEGSSAYLSITGVYMSNISNNYILDIDQEQITINVSNYPLGAYVITLITDGNISDSENLIIQ